jgi:transposase
MNKRPKSVEICAMLREGYGVEDIAVKMGISVERVRFEVRRIRDNGYLPTFYAHARKEWAKSA